MTLKEKNQKLIKDYPFLDPRHWETVNPNDYDYEFTELDEMPEGWKQAFGEQMCKEIKQELIRCNYLDEYRILEIKEKFGMLRWYDCGVPDECKVPEIIEKYHRLSATTCIGCGKPATKISRGWISPWCDDCIQDTLLQTTDIQDYYEMRKELKDAEKM